MEQPFSICELNSPHICKVLFCIFTTIILYNPNYGRKSLAEIWQSDDMDTLLPVIKDKGYSFADNIKQDTFITRFYSSFSDGTDKGLSTDLPAI